MKVIWVTSILLAAFVFVAVVISSFNDQEFETQFDSTLTTNELATPSIVDGESDETILSIPEIYEKSSLAVVTIVMVDAEGRPISKGSGFILGSGGTVITNRHVIDDPDARQAKVILDSNLYTVDRIFAWSETLDLAALKFGFPAKGKGYASLSLELDKPRIGEDVVAIGSPAAGGLNSITKGIISNLFVSEKDDEVLLIQTDASINPGNSGGPLINSRGKVIGINTLRPDKTSNDRPILGIGFAIPAKRIQRLLLFDNSHPFGSL